MTLRNLTPSRPQQAAGGPTRRDTAMIFVLDRAFLIGLKVLAHSMISHATLLDVPIIILSDDATLGDDPFVAELADRFAHISDEQLAGLQGIRGDEIHPIVKLDGPIPKYTFLKWLIFDDWGYDQLIWIDTDILCLGGLDHLTALREDGVYASCVFSRDLIEAADKSPLPPEVAAENMRQLVAGAGTRFNSGVMVISGRFLNPLFRSLLVGMAQKDTFPNEQSVVREALEKHGGRGWLSPLDNYHHSYWAATPPDIQSQVRLLHYVGASGKPWNFRRKHAKDAALLWWKAYDMAQAEGGMFEEPLPVLNRGGK